MDKASIVPTPYFLLTADFWELRKHKHKDVMANEALKHALRDVIEQLTGEKSTFDSHEIINKLIELHERDYVELLYSHINDSKGAFKGADAQIGKAVSDNASYFGVRKRNEKVSSSNIKDNDSECACWDVIR